MSRLGPGNPWGCTGACHIGSGDSSCGFRWCLSSVMVHGDWAAVGERLPLSLPAGQQCIRDCTIDILAVK